MSVGEYKIPEAVVLSHENLCKEGKIYVPIYMTFCLDEFMEKDDPKTIRPYPSSHFECREEAQSPYSHNPRPRCTPS